MSEIQTVTLQQLEDFWRTVKENEAKAGELQERMKAIALDPSKRNEAGVAEYWSLAEQAKRYWQNIDDAYRKFREAGDDER
jgi:hypothetical protein